MVETNEAYRFWMVWNPMGRSPTRCHQTRSDADAEAQRLAKNNPNQRFYVLKAVSGFVAQEPEPTEILIKRAQTDAFDGVPF